MEGVTLQDAGARRGLRQPRDDSQDHAQDDRRVHRESLYLSRLSIKVQAAMRFATE